MSRATPTPDHLPQLDTLRALAVAAVMIHHWLPGFLGFGGWGDLGVRCFFVLSGFLITRILLRARASMEQGRSSFAWQAGRFYARRSLRIFPIYYLTLAVGALLGMQALRDTWPWHAAYLSNHYFASRGAWQGYLSHLWSLSVEEQFYLLWPALVLLLPRRGLPVLFATCVGVAVLSRAACAIGWGPEHLALKVLLPCCLDPLVAGAWLAWHRASPAVAGDTAAPRRLRGFPAAALVFVLLGFLDFADTGKTFRHIAGPLLESLFFVGVVDRCAQRVDGWLGRGLDLRPLQYLGRISYGIYLFHLFAGYVAGMVANKFQLTLPPPGIAQFSLYLAMTLAAAAFSERWIERPLNNLKNRFPPDPPTPRPARARTTVRTILPPPGMEAAR